MASCSHPNPSLHHSWPLSDAEARFADGRDGTTVTLLGGPPPSRWQCASPTPR
ncbi:hypothetical protein AB5I41_01870 [Sphingomonas sp. MMS24-JH45]